MHFSWNEAKENLIEDYLEQETAIAWNRVEAAETGIMRRRQDIRIPEKVGRITRKTEKTFDEMFNAIVERPSDLAGSNNEEDGEDEVDVEEQTELRKLSNDDKPTWVMGTISTTVHQCMESVREPQMRLEELTQPGWGDAPDYSCERDEKSAKAELIVQAVIQLRMGNVAATPAPTPVGALQDYVRYRPRKIANTARDFSTRK